MALSRRRFIRGAVIGGALAVTPAALAACGGDDNESESPTNTPGVASTTAATAAATAAAATPTSTPAATKRGPSSGTLRLAEPFLPASLDADTGSAAFNLQFLGALECLMKFGPDLQVEPWIAASIERKDTLTWHVKLRDDVTFWDGAKVDAAAVRASLVRSMEKQPGTADQLPPGTEFTASGLDLTIKTPTPIGRLAFNLANPAFSIKKPGVGEELIYTGPFRITGFAGRDFVDLEAYEGYRGGPAWVKEIKARQVADTNARSLALQSGDVDIAQALLPSDVAKLKSTGLTVFTSPWARQHMVILNVKQAPFDDVAVREAFSLAVDRDLLVSAIMEGAASPGRGIAPEDIGLKNVVQTQGFDLAKAKSILDATGWVPGSDGIREKGGQKLSFTLGTYAGRAELEQSAVAMVDMLKAAGMDATIEKYADIEKTVAENTFQATTYSIGSAAFGDISRLLSTLYVPSSRNKDRYSNAEVNAAFATYLGSSNEAEQDTLLKTIQEQIGKDFPIVHLFNPRQVVRTSKKVTDFAPHPLDSYKLNENVKLEG